MTATTAVFKREFRSYFATPVAAVFLTVFLFLAMFMTFRAGWFEMRQASMQMFFSGLPVLFALFAPAIAMRLWADERRSGTIELLLTLPVTTTQAVIGKFVAAWLFFGVALLLTTSMVFTTDYLGDPDFGPIVTGYIGSFLMAGAYLAIGGFFSALTKNQVIAFVLGALACLVLVFIGHPSVIESLQGAPFLSTFFVSFAEGISFTTHFERLERGLVEARNLFYMFAIMVGFLIATVVVLKEAKAR